MARFGLKMGGNEARKVQDHFKAILSATRNPPGLLSGKVFWSYCVQSWYSFLLIRCNLMVIVDIAEMDGPCSNMLNFSCSGDAF